MNIQLRANKCNNVAVFFLILFHTTTIQAQVTLTGFIQDNLGEPLPGASIRLLNSPKGTVSNEDGKYILDQVPTGVHYIEVSYIGYQTTRQQVNISASVEMNFQLSISSSTLGEIIVTANKELQNLQETPVAMTALTSEQIEKLQIDEVTELNRVAANFRSYDDGGSSFQMFASRGIYTIDFSPTIGFYVDDVPFFNVLGFPTQLVDVERIEILKGPQGTLYGRNALAGVVNVITQKPTNITKGFAELGYGNLNQWRASAGVSLPIIKDQLFARISGSYLERDGYIENIALDDGTDVLEREVFTGNLRLNYYPSDRLSFTLSSNVEDRTVRAYALVGGFGVPGEALDSLKENHPFEVNFNRQGTYETISSNSALKVSYDFPKFTLNSISALQYFKLTRKNDDFDFTPFDLNYLTEGARKQTTFSEEIRLNSSNDSRLQWIGGVFIYRAENEDTQPVFNTAFTGHSAGDYIQQSNSVVTQTGVAIFGQLDFKITDRLSLLGGLRYEIERSEVDVERFHLQNGEIFEAPEGTITTPQGMIPSPLLTDTFDARATFDALSPKIGFTYKISEDIFLFGHATRGYRPGGLNPFTNSANETEYEPESSWNYELGLKTSWLDNRLRANLTGFYIVWNDQQLFNLIDLNNFIFGIDNIGKSRSQGLELEMEWVPLQGLNLIANIGYLDTRISDFTLLNFFGEEIDNEGNEQGYSPHWNGNLSANYTWNLSKKIKLFTGLDYLFQTEMYFDPENTVRQDAYGLINGRLGIAYGSFELTTWVKNLSDVVYYSYGYGVGATQAFASYGLPRTYGVNLQIKF